MSSARLVGGGRLRAYTQFLAAVIYFFVAQGLAQRGAAGLATEQWTPLVEQAMLLFLLIVGYAGMGYVVDRDPQPVKSQGLAFRGGWPGEAGVGIAIGWSLALVCVLALVVAGGIAIVLVLDAKAGGWLLADAVFFALAAMAEEVAFRGYGFQRFAHAVGPLGAMLGYAAFFAIVQGLVPGASRAGVAVSVALSLVLSTAYLRTRALWFSWGVNFGWKASRALVFGLAVGGVNNHSPVVQGNPMGPFWLTGGGYGLDGSWVAFGVLLLGIPVVYRLTRELDYRYNAPEIVPGGIPVDLDAAQKRQHEAAMGVAAAAAPSTSQLVQILPALSPPVAAAVKELPPEGEQSPH